MFASVRHDKKQGSLGFPKHHVFFSSLLYGNIEINMARWESQRTAFEFLGGSPLSRWPSSPTRLCRALRTVPHSDIFHRLSRVPPQFGGNEPLLGNPQGSVADVNRPCYPRRLAHIVFRHLGPKRSRV